MRTVFLWRYSKDPEVKDFVLDVNESTKVTAAKSKWIGRTDNDGTMIDIPWHLSDFSCCCEFVPANISRTVHSNMRM